MLYPIPPINIPSAPTSNVQPFTYKDGITYLERLEWLIRYMNLKLIPFINESYKELSDEVNGAINTVINQVNDLVQSIINSSIEVQDPVVEALIKDVNSLTRKALEEIFPDDADIAEWIANQSSATHNAIIDLLPTDHDVAGWVKDANAETHNEVVKLLPTNNTVAAWVNDKNGNTRKALDAIYRIFITPTQYGAVGDGVANDTAAWNAWKAAKGIHAVMPGKYKINGAVYAFTHGVVGNAEFDDVDYSWDQATGDHERHTIILHHNDLNANNEPVSPVIKTQTHVKFEVDNPSGSFKDVVGGYHEAVIDGYYNTRADTNQNYTVFGSSVFNRMAGLFGTLAYVGSVKDAKESENARINTMGGSKNGVAFFQFTRRALYKNGGYMFGLEIYAQNQADETDPVAYTNNDEFSFTTWTSGIKISANASGAPISTALFTSGLSSAKHGFWNGLIVGGSSFKINNEKEGVAGTVGINLASWRAGAGYADIGIKFREANRHLYFREGAKIRSSLVRFMHELGSQGIALEAGSGGTPYISLRTGATAANDGGAVTDVGGLSASTSATRLNNKTGEVQLVVADGAVTYSATTARFAPGTDTDGSMHLGASNRRWATVYAATGTINTSDERFKNYIREIPDVALDAWGDVNYRLFKMNDAVKLKGDEARTHSGVIAQQVIEAFNKHGLNASDYALLCHDSWDHEPEVVEEYEIEIKPPVYEQVLVKDAVYEDRVMDDGTIEHVLVSDPVYEDGDIIVPAVVETVRNVKPEVQAGDIYSIRYEEALVFEAAYQRRRANSLESRIKNLENKVLNG